MRDFFEPIADIFLMDFPDFTDYMIMGFFLITSPIWMPVYIIAYLAHKIYSLVYKIHERS